MTDAEHHQRNLEVQKLVDFVEEVAGLDCAKGTRDCGQCLYCRARALLRRYEEKK